MFTGLVSDTGRIAKITDAAGVRRLKVESSYPADSVDPGASICHSGVCLTVVEFGPTTTGSWWDVEAVPETLNLTTLRTLKTGDMVNLEQSLRVGDELGGHFVYGHVDGVGTISAIEPDGGSRRLTIEASADVLAYIARKGSVAVDGISLTVADVHSGSFEIAVIPHTWNVTTLQYRSVGSLVNLEVDMLARYVARLREVE